jgi:phosphatidate cytidylyltransferase
MLLRRVLAALVLAAIGLPAIIFGHIPYFTLITIFLVLAAWEYAQLFRAAGFFPATALVVGGVFLVVAVRKFFPEMSAMVLAFLGLAAMTWHLIAYERGRDQAATDFGITIGGIIYLGWIGAYLIDLRDLPDGLWYLLLSLGAVWIADSAAYFIGSRFGRHKLSPRLSPKKTWEGYWGGVLFGTLGGVGLVLLWPILGGINTPWWQGGLLGLVLSLLTTLGDLGESMIKRQAKSKDSSNLIPGHGGFLDRVDSWLWAAVLGYYYVIWFIN